MSKIRERERWRREREKRGRFALPVEGFCDKLEVLVDAVVGVTGLILMPFRVLTERVGVTESAVLDEDVFALSIW